VIRDMFYDGHPAPETRRDRLPRRAVFRALGNFQSWKRSPQAARRLRDRHHFAGCRTRSGLPRWCRRTALLMVDWMRLGFVHGVMNTDNLSILGVTIDYGPYGWLEATTLSDAEHHRPPAGGYCDGNQLADRLWNLRASLKLWWFC